MFIVNVIELKTILKNINRPIEANWRKYALHSFNSKPPINCGTGVNRSGLFSRLALPALLYLALYSALVFFALPVRADDQPDREKIDFNIPQQRADYALTAFAEQAKLTLIFPFDKVKEITANRLVGSYSAEEGAMVLLQGTRLKPLFSDASVLNIKIEEPGNHTMDNKKGLLAAVISFIIGSGGAHTAGAQTDPSKGSRATRLLEEVVVSARKKSAGENAQSVPLTLTAVSGDQIEAAFISDLTELGYTMPNVRLDESSFPGVANYTIRGMGFISTIASAEPTVGVFVDGVYLGSNLGSSMGTFDLESVEVLRGPQGTLFGRNVTAGAVVMRSRRPDGEFAGAIRAGVGSGGRELVGGSIEGSLSDTVAAKIYTEFNHRDGDFDNTFLNEDHGEEDSIFLRPIVVWRPTTDFDLTAIYEYGDIDGDGTTGRTLNDPTTSFYGMGAREPDEASDVELNFPGKTEIEWNQFTLEANWNIGDGTITSITGYRDVEYGSSGDTDASSIAAAYGFVGVEQDQFSQELRYASRAFDDKLDYTIGFYYFEQELDNTYEVLFFGSAFQRPRGKIEHTTYSVFAQGDYELATDVYLTAGLRWDNEEKDATIARGVANCDENFNCNYDFEGSEDWSNITPKIGLSWHVNENVLLYANWSKGFRSGGFNSRATNPTEIPGPYDEEEVVAKEIGLKSDLMGGKARINAAIFSNKYDDLQRVVSDDALNLSIRNAASATIEGAELEITIVPIDSLALQANVGYLDATYDDFPGLDVDGDLIGDPEQAKGLQLVRAPEWTYTFSATYDQSLGNAGSLVSRIAYTYSDDTPMNDANRYTLEGYELIDASLTWASASEHLSVSLWGKNLTDEAYALTGTTSSFFTYLYQSLPRTYGVEAVYRF